MVCEMHRWIKKAIIEARKSTYHHRIGCVIFNKGQFISSGYNVAERSIKSHHPSFRHWETSIHAEVAAIIKARKTLTNASILVIRINSNEDLMMAKPCKHCQTYINFVGIKKVFYSTNKGEIVRL